MPNLLKRVGHLQICVAYAYLIFCQIKAEEPRIAAFLP